MGLKEYEELSFSELAEKINMEKGKAKMDFHLSKLVEGALVEHVFRHQIGNEKFSFYRTTNFGKNVWNNIANSLQSSLQRFERIPVIDEIDCIYSKKPNMTPAQIANKAGCTPLLAKAILNRAFRKTSGQNRAI